MEWNEIKKKYPNQWIVIEAIDAHSTSDNYRHIEDAIVIDKFKDGEAAMSFYRNLHKSDPLKEYYFLHTSRKDLNIPERKWLGVRC